MEKVVIAAGSNLGNRLEYLKKTGHFLEQLSGKKLKKASIWESEPVGGAKYTFLNTAALLYTDLSAVELLTELKNFELLSGREKNPERWGPRVIDLDIITFGDLVIEQESLIIPHPEYKNRLFVLNPMAELEKTWKDPITGLSIDELQKNAPQISINKTNYSW